MKKKQKNLRTENVFGFDINFLKIKIPEGMTSLWLKFLMILLSHKTDLSEYFIKYIPDFVK